MVLPYHIDLYLEMYPFGKPASQIMNIIKWNLRNRLKYLVDGMPITRLPAIIIVKLKSVNYS